MTTNEILIIMKETKSKWLTIFPCFNITSLYLEFVRRVLFICKLLTFSYFIVQIYFIRNLG